MTDAQYIAGIVLFMVLVGVPCLACVLLIWNIANSSFRR